MRICKRFKNIKEVEKHVEKYVQAHRFAHQEKILSAPRRRAFPKRWKRDDKKPLRRKIMYLRRTARDASDCWRESFW